MLRALVDVTALVALVQCGVWGQPHTTREKGTIAGGVLGAGTGAILGANGGRPGAGAAIGRGIGRWGLIGNELQNREVAEHHLNTGAVPRQPN